MGLFSKSSKSEQAAEPAPSGSDGAQPVEAEKKTGWYQRWQDKKRGQPISNEELQKHLGMDRSQLNTWASTTPGVGKNQLASQAGQGHQSGVAGMAMAEGYGGWGRDGHQDDGKRGMKFPPQKADGN